jgi:hypothetical protein
MTKQEFQSKFEDYSELLQWDNEEKVYISYTLHGDYTGSTVERSNYEYLKEKNYKWIEEIYYSYSTNCIGINYENISEEGISELTEILESLSNYPCLDDSLLSEMEYNLIQETISDFKKLNQDYLFSYDFDNKAYDYLSEHTCHAYFVDFSESDFIEKMISSGNIQPKQEENFLHETLKKYMEKNPVISLYENLLIGLDYHDFEELKNRINNGK